MDDELKHKTDDAKGAAKEHLGRATDDEQMGREGRSEQTKSNLKQAAEKVKDASTRTGPDPDRAAGFRCHGPGTLFALTMQAWECSTRRAVACETGPPAGAGPGACRRQGVAGCGTAGGMSTRGWSVLL